MRTITPVFLFALMLLVTSVLVPGATAQDKKDKAGAVAKWEHHVASFRDLSDADLQTELDKLGDEGWELVGFNTRYPAGPAGKTDIRFVFKRPKR